MSCCRIASSTWTFQTAYLTSIKSMLINSHVQQIGHIICIEQHHCLWCLLYRGGIKVDQRNDTKTQSKHDQTNSSIYSFRLALQSHLQILCCKIVFFSLEGQPSSTLVCVSKSYCLRGFCYCLLNYWQKSLPSCNNNPSSPSVST